MAQQFELGDLVTCTAGQETGQETATGIVRGYVAAECEVGGQKTSASEDSPCYLVLHENTGNVTVHEPETLTLLDRSSQDDLTRHAVERTRGKSCWLRLQCLSPV